MFLWDTPVVDLFCACPQVGRHRGGGRSCRGGETLSVAPQRCVCPACQRQMALPWCPTGEQVRQGMGGGAGGWGKQDTPDHDSQ